MKLNNKNITILFCVVSFILILPFILNAFFIHPSVDDFSFASNADKLGFIGALKDWYTSWTGRYFSTALLSAHPLSLGLPFLYKIYSILFVVFIFYSIYYFLQQTLLNHATVLPLILLSSLLTLWYLDTLPTLVQGIYWLPGSITYMLPNILLLFFITHTIQELKKEKSTLRLNFGINLFFILAICGSNETSMVVLIFYLLSLNLYYFLLSKKWKKTFLFYLAMAIFCGLIVYFAPGNAVRGKGEIGTVSLLSCITDSITTLFTYIWIWIQQLTTLLILLFTFLSFVLGNKTKTVARRPFFYIVLVGVTLLFLSVFTTFWAVNLPPVDRTLNVTFWLFILLCTFIIYHLAILFKTSRWNKQLKGLKKYSNALITFNLGLYVVVLFLHYGNFTLSFKDLFLGRSTTFAKEYRARIKTIKTSPNSIVHVPSYSRYPNSIYNPNLRLNNPFIEENDFWNKRFAGGFNKQMIKLNYTPPIDATTFSYSLDDSNKRQRLENLHTLSKERYKSPPYSSHLDSVNHFGALLNIKAAELKRPPFYIYTSIDAYTPEKGAVFGIILSVTNVSSGEINWKAIWVNEKKFPSNKWEKINGIFKINSRVRENAYRYKIYVWNNSNKEVFLDNISASFY